MALFWPHYKILVLENLPRWIAGGCLLTSVPAHIFKDRSGWITSWKLHQLASNSPYTSSVIPLYPHSKAMMYPDPEWKTHRSKNPYITVELEAFHHCFLFYTHACWGLNPPFLRLEPHFLSYIPLYLLLFPLISLLYPITSNFYCIIYPLKKKHMISLYHSSTTSFLILKRSTTPESAISFHAVIFRTSFP